MNISESTLQRVTDFISLNRLVEPQERILIGVSGGVDSLVLADVLHRLNYPVQALHVNFQLRGEESERDEQHTIRFCQARGIPYSTVRFETAEVASDKGISIEMAARELRYDYFRSYAQNNGLRKIAVGHHADDSVETILLNLLRGTGIKGLTGIKARNGEIIRPLLALTRKEIVEYAVENAIEYITDSSNNETCYQRNKLRLDIIPQFKEINGAAERHILECAERLSEAETVFQNYLQERIALLCRSSERNEIEIPIEALLSERYAHTLLHEILSPFGFNNAVSKEIVDRLREFETGKRFLSASHIVLKDRERLLIRPLPETETPLEQPLPEGCTQIDYPISLRFQRVELPVTFQFQKQHFYADEAKVRYPLRLRKWQHGDTFAPFGMEGRRRKVSDFFAENHFTAFRKEETFLLCDRDDEIIWIVGYRTSEKIRIDQHTTHILQITLLK